MLRLNFTSIIPDKLKEFKIPTIKLKEFKIPTVDRAKIVKFFYEAYLDVHEDELAEYQKPQTKAEELPENIK